MKHDPKPTVQEVVDTIINDPDTVDLIRTTYAYHTCYGTASILVTKYLDDNDLATTYSDNEVEEMANLLADLVYEVKNS